MEGRCVEDGMSHAADLGAILRSLALRLDALELYGGGLDGGKMGARIVKTRVVLPPRIGPYSRVGYVADEGVDARKLFFGVYWGWLTRRFMQDVSGGVRLKVITYPELVEETRMVSAVFSNYIDGFWRAWEKEEVLRGEKAANPGQRFYGAGRHQDDVGGWGGGDGVLSKKDRWRHEGRYGGGACWNDFFSE